MNAATLPISTRLDVAAGPTPQAEQPRGVSTLVRAIVGFASAITVAMASWGLATANAADRAVAAPVPAEVVAPEIIDSLAIERTDAS